MPVRRAVGQGRRVVAGMQGPARIAGPVGGSPAIWLAICLVLAGVVQPAQPVGGVASAADVAPPLADWVWEKVDTPRPPSREDHAMAYDAARKVTVLFGGHDNCAVKGDTWEWDGLTWTQRNLGGGGPAPRYGHSMVYHPGKKMVLLFGGASACSGAVTYFNDLWGWNGQTWQKLSLPSDTISGRQDAVMAWDGDHQRVVVYGGGAGTGLFKDTWFWKNGWTFHPLPAGSTPPNVVLGASGAYRLGDGLLVAGNGRFYLFDGSKWNDLTDASSPPIVHSSAMVTMPDVIGWTTDNDVVLLFGGAVDLTDSSYSDETWTFAFDGWALKWTAYKPAGTPPPRHSHAMAYDTSRQEVLLFGGKTPAGASNDFYIMHAPRPRHVATSGTDAGNCTDYRRPCKTIRYALLHSPPGGEIKLQAGDYDAIHESALAQTQTVLIGKDITIRGGYGSRYVDHERPGPSRIVGFEGGFLDSGPRGVTVRGGVTATLDHVDVWWGTHKLGGAIYNDGDLTLQYSTVTLGGASQAGGCLFGTPNSVFRLEHVTVSDCRTYGVDAHGAGIYSNGRLLTFDTVITRNVTEGDGGGIFQFNGLLGMLNTTLLSNEARNGGGLYTDSVGSSAPAASAAAASLRSSTPEITFQNVDMAYNRAAQRGGGAYFKQGTGYLKNISVLRNAAGAGGGGVHVEQASLRLEHSLLALNKGAADCSGAITSEGYNLIGNIGGACTLTPSATATGDQVGTMQSPIDPKVDANGVPLPGSPALNRGSPAGTCAPNDRRGFDRSLTLPCDIGAYESTITPGATKPLLPEDTRYVSKTGDDANDCLSPQTACATLQRAMQGAPYAGTVAVSGGVFMPGSSETWFVDQPVRFSGGWSADFSEQSGWTTIDGEGVNCGLSVGQLGAATFENFEVQNGAGLWGGGVYNSGSLTLLRSLVVDNRAEKGAGIFNQGELQVISSLVARNVASEVGGGLYVQDGLVQLQYVTLAGNQRVALSGAGTQAVSVAGIYKEGGELHASNSILAANPAAAGDDTCWNGAVFDTLTYSLVNDPRCAAQATDGNIQGDPGFVAADDGDFHLTATSPAIDTGDPDSEPTADIDGDWRPCHAPGVAEARVDMGFDEYAEGRVCYATITRLFLPLVQE